MSSIEYVGITIPLPFIYRHLQKTPSEENNRLDGRRLAWVVPVVFGFVIWMVTRGKVA